MTDEEIATLEEMQRLADALIEVMNALSLTAAEFADGLSALYAPPAQDCEPDECFWTIDD